MNECFLITSYCNNEEKINILKKNISELSKYNIDIMLHAHYPLNLEIQKSVKYYIYNSTNPVISNGTKSIVNWWRILEIDKKLSSITPDVGYAVMKQWEQGLNFLYNSGYEKIYIINFDVFIKDYIFYNSREYLNNHDISFYFLDYNSSDNFTNFEQLNTMYLCIKRTIILDFLNELTYEKYVNSIDTCLETYLSSEVVLRLEKKYSIKKVQPNEFNYSSKDKTSDIIDCITNYDLFRQYNREKDDFFYFIGKNKKSNLIEVIFHNIKSNINKIEVYISNYYFLYFVDNKNYIFFTNINGDKLNDLINNKKILIKINDKIFNGDYKKFINAIIE